MTAKIGAVVLAAGFSNRFGSIKLCAPLNNGKTVFQQTLERLGPAISKILVVTRPELAELLVDHVSELQVFHQAERGMGATLAFAASLIADWDGALICLADMPFIETDTYRRIAAQLESDNIVIPTCDSRPGNPVGFGRAFFPALTRLSGDSGGRPVVQTNPDAVFKLDVRDQAILADIDTPEDLSRYQAGLAG